MTKHKKLLSIISIVLIFIGMYVFVLQNKEEKVINEKPVSHKPSEEQFYANLKAFGKLYGYVRYFHPSDEASELDWNRFAVYGVGKIKNASNEEELKKILEELFLPIAPTMSIYFENEKPKPYKSHVKEGKFIAWQHYGLGHGTENLYKSERFTATLTEDTYKVDGLFEAFPKKNEVIKEDISKSLICSIPLALPLEISDNNNGTSGSHKKSLTNYQNLNDNLLNMDPNLTSENENVRLAGVIVTWNVIQHFYPHLRNANLDLEKQLDNSLKDTSDDQSKEEYLVSLNRFIEKTNDGQSMSFESYFNGSKKVPFTMDFIENQLVVTEVDSNTPVKIGDIIHSINGINTIVLIEQLSKEIPGSHHYKRFMAIHLLHYYKNTITIKIKRENQMIDVAIEDKENPINEGPMSVEEPVIELEKGIYYFNHAFINSKNYINQNNEVLSNARGLIIDIRNQWYPTDIMEEILAHLTDTPIKGPIKKVMQTIYPDQRKVTYSEIRDEILPKQPLYRGKVVFLTNAGTARQLEYLLGFVKEIDKKTIIIGQPTSGTVGNVQTYHIPGNVVGTFTAMEVLNGDGSPIQNEGIIPDILVTRTLNGVIKREDEYLTKALEWINNE